MNPMSALTEGILYLRRVTLTADEATAARHRSEQIQGRRQPVSQYERGLYEAEGRTPPED